MWIGIVTPAASTFSLSLRYSYTIPHWVIPSYRSQDSGCFALIYKLVRVMAVNTLIYKLVKVIAANIQTI